MLKNAPSLYAPPIGTTTKSLKKWIPKSFQPKKKWYTSKNIRKFQTVWRILDSTIQISENSTKWKHDIQQGNAIYLICMHQKAVLHMFYIKMGFQLVIFITNKTAGSFWKNLINCCTSFYTWFSEVIRFEREAGFKSKYFWNNSEYICI